MIVGCDVFRLFPVGSQETFKTIVKSHNNSPNNAPKLNFNTHNTLHHHLNLYSKHSDGSVE